MIAFPRLYKGIGIYIQKGAEASAGTSARPVINHKSLVDRDLGKRSHEFSQESDRPYQLGATNQLEKITS
jgi:hypothetical protein